MFEPTQRSFTNVETNRKFTLYQSYVTGKYKLIYDTSDKNNPMDMANGTEVNGFFICAHTDCHIKINNNKVVYIPQGSFYHTKEGEEITHKKYTGAKIFSKI